MMTRVCALSDLDDRKPFAVEVGDTSVVLVRDGDTVHALRDECSHAEIPLSEGEVEQGRNGRLAIECWLHGSCFDVRTGIPSAPPAGMPVDVFPVDVINGEVQVDPTQPLNNQTFQR